MRPRFGHLIHEVVSYLTLKILVLTRFRCSITDRDNGIAIVVIVHLSTPLLQHTMHIQTPTYTSIGVGKVRTNGVTFADRMKCLIISSL